MLLKCKKQLPPQENRKAELVISFKPYGFEEQEGQLPSQEKREAGKHFENLKISGNFFGIVFKFMQLSELKLDESELGLDDSDDFPFEMQ